ncbi:MAG TPA: STAS domain-containing protein [Acidimicrobiales bacterium]
MNFVADDPGSLQLSVAEAGGNAEVSVRGEVDIHTCADLERTLTTLADKGVQVITLDLGEVAFIDSSGLRALVVGHKALQDHGGSLVVANPSSSTARLLEVTGLDGLFDVES